jgi:phage-related protein
MRNSRPVSWIKAARKAFDQFSDDARSRCWFALTIAAEGSKADIAKPLHGLGPGVFEIAVQVHGVAFRLIYALSIDKEMWVLHGFKKKSTKGIKTPRREIDVVAKRLKWLKESLQ